MTMTTSRDLAVSALEELVRRLAPDYDRIYDGASIELVVDTLIAAAQENWV